MREGEPVDLPAIRDALRALKDGCHERWPLDQFWVAANWGKKIGRWQNLSASLNGIQLQLGLPAGWEPSNW
ncbi:hypothetical protein [Sphingomonas sp. MMS24-J13]|uniref:hypothetical protein n=1 Tax=Sphingomonas sp. MMS24-J13 TaxID=3238686 RepID=UPI00384DD175